MSAISVTCRFLTLDNVLGIYIPVDIIILTATFSENSVMSFGCPLIAPLDEVAMHYGVPRKSVDLEWKKDLLRFLPKGQGDIKCHIPDAQTHLYSKESGCEIVNNV